MQFPVQTQKLIEWIDRKVEGYSRPEKHHEPIQHNSDLYNFHFTVGYKFYSSSHRLQTRRQWNKSKDIKQGASTSWSKGTEIIQNLFFYHHGIKLEISIKRWLKIAHIFSGAMWCLPREIFDLAIESLSKVRRLKKHRGWLQRINEKLISKIL